jgi:lipopolysaccharide export system protein LptA
MFEQLSPPIKLLGMAVLCGCALTAPRPALALATDSAQDIEIVANTSEIDDRRNVTIFTGQVIVTQGSIRITGDKMTLYYNEQNDIDTLVMEGNPAIYSQLPDASSVRDEARARRMEYQKLKNLIILIEQAQVRQASGSLSGQRIEYDTALSRVRATSEPAGKQTETKPGERVKIIIPAQPE